MTNYLEKWDDLTSGLSGTIKDASLYHFSDASKEGYGQSVHLQLANASRKLNCCLMMEKEE